MNKRSAALMAAGLAVVLMLGGVAFSLGLMGPTASVAAPRAADHAKPIVRTHTKRIVVHKQAPAPAPVVASASEPTTFTASGYDDGRNGFDDGGSGGDD